MGLLADIQALSTASVQLATDTAAVAAAQVSLASLQATVASDTAAGSTADATLSADLKTSGPAYTVNADGTASFYAFSDMAPGYTIVVAALAS